MLPKQLEERTAEAKTGMVMITKVPWENAGSDW
jgi:hypothetical protein